jgi:hypothetical protein
MRKDICDFRSSPKDIEHFSGNKVIFIFLKDLCSHFFFNFYFIQTNNFFILIVHILTISFAFVDLPVKLFFSKKFCNSKKQSYYVSRYNSMKVNVIVPPPLTWHICHIIVDSFGHVVFVCILNQSKGHWLLSDALNFTISDALPTP